MYEQWYSAQTFSSSILEPNYAATVQQKKKHSYVVVWKSGSRLTPKWGRFYHPTARTLCIPLKRLRTQSQNLICCFVLVCNLISHPMGTTGLQIVKTAVFWDAVPCSLVDIYRRFRDDHCLHHSDSGGIKFLRIVVQYLPDYTVQHSRKQPYSYWDVHYSLQIIKVMDYLRKSNYLKPEIYIITKLSLDWTT